MGNSLDTDDIVALSVSIPLIVLACVLAVVAWVITTKRLKAHTKRILQLRDKNIGQRVDKDGKVETYHKSILQVLVGDELYNGYKEMLIEKYGKLPTLKELQDIISPETIFAEIYFSLKQPN